MKLNDKVYDVLKWVVLVALPALGTFYATISMIWGFPFSEEIPATILAVEFLLGALLGISTLQYNKDHSA